MQELFEAKERPLYGQAVPMRLGRLPSSDIAAYIVDRFKQTRRSAGECVEPLVADGRRPSAARDALAYRLWDVDRAAGGTGTLRGLGGRRFDRRCSS